MRFLIILSGKGNDIRPEQRQDVNSALKKIFDTSITFFPKNVPIPAFVHIERSKIDSHAEAEREYTENSAREYLSDGSTEEEPVCEVDDRQPEPLFDDPDNPEQQQ